MPAGVLLVLLLGALAVDHALVFMAERQVANLAAAAANDAATAAVDRAELYAGGAVVLDPARARAAAEATVGTQLPGRIDGVALDVLVDPVAATVTVHVTGTVPFLFSDAVPGAAGQAAVGATATAVALED
jgi:Flp pilus assembly protein TadG